MNRNMMRAIALALALSTWGCLASSGSNDDGVGAVQELDGPRVVTFEAEGAALSSAAGAVDTESTHTNGTTLGPQPDPWLDNDGEGPQPDPWLGRTKPAPPPDQGGDPSDGSKK